MKSASGLISTEINQKPEKHPSGLTMERWNWPFKTPEERVLVAKYFAKTMKQEKRDEVNTLGEAPF